MYDKKAIDELIENKLIYKENIFTQREYTIEDFEKLYANNQWQNNE